MVLRGRDSEGGLPSLLLIHSPTHPGLRPPPREGARNTQRHRIRDKGTGVGIKASGFRFHFLLREPPDLRVLGGHGAARRVRSPPRAAGGLGCAPRGKPAALGPRPLRLLPAISGARPPLGHAGQGSNKIPWEAGGRAVG